jgi:3-hydroxyacyl-CoA dehydrogenase
VIEAIVEDLDAKKKLFAELGRLCKPDAILASNTSSFPIGEMAEASGRPARFVGLHFFNPVQLMKLVEVVRTAKTDENVFAAARAFGEGVGKTPVACKDTPGFVVNRLLVPYMTQALQMLERGDATKEDIDAAMQYGCGYPMGPITLTDYVGLDTTLSILEGWVARFPKEPAFAIPEILRKKVAEKKLGRKSGEGFYKWQGDKKV